MFDYTKFVAIDRDRVEFENVDGKFLLYLSGVEQFYELKSSVINFVWPLLNGVYTIQEVFDKILMEYDVDSSKLSKDFEEFLIMMKQLNILILSNKKLMLNDFKK